ncbi:hypothetical protein CHS0354_015439 [Potamilus streckersoni]|uniref:Uncharacterized protein n=1 Tax=Potamilus streckersoni TaxID=2493646 RepID=A0AAE0SM15_9BIVA|nr:hypothetical protein CHS0354_015439 [Potamilus streckersoni]
MEIWKTPLLFCAVLVIMTGVVMMDEISFNSIVSDADNNSPLDLRSFAEKYMKMLQEEIKIGISIVSSACKIEVMQMLFKREQALLSEFEAVVKDLRYECTASPPSVEHAFFVVTHTSDNQQVATYTCDAGYRYGGGKKEVWCNRDLGRWDSATLKCVECFTSRDTYRGKKSITQGGIQCQRWDSQSPHQHSLKSKDFIEKNISLTENNCRITKNTFEPWCYTIDPNMEWDYCGMTQCNRKFENDCGLPQILANAKPHYTYTSNGATARYECLQLSDSTQNGYCPVSTCMNTGWTDASISCGNHDCFRSTTEYTGKRNCTISGRTCQAWISTHPHDHRYTSQDFPDGSLSKVGNYCRDPNGSGTLWCYTTDRNVRYEPCDVPSCDLFPLKPRCQGQLSTNITDTTSYLYCLYNGT